MSEEKAETTKQRFSAPVRRGFAFINKYAIELKAYAEEGKLKAGQLRDVEAALRYIEENKE